MVNKNALIDIGANLTHDQLFKKIPSIIKKFKASHVQKVIITSSNIHDTEIALDLIKKFPNVFYTTVGFHPHNAKDFEENDIEKMKVLTNNSNIVAIGECGLDYYREYSPKKQQIECFEKQLDLCSKIDLPIFLHERGSHNDFYSMVKEYINKIDNCVVHCFTGTKNELLKYVDLGCYIGITGWITDLERGSHLHDIIKLIPEDKLMVETDSPYLMPKNINKSYDTLNEPAYLPYIVEVISKCLNKDIEYVCGKTYENTKRFFKI
ncbi:MAG: TatD family hydrolase [Pseudomonadota bacterium]|nr:TatD family hydrolase [Pseudomonadota bacterium]